MGEEKIDEREGMMGEEEEGKRRKSINKVMEVPTRIE